MASMVVVYLGFPGSCWVSPSHRRPWPETAFVLGHSSAILYVCGGARCRRCAGHRLPEGGRVESSRGKFMMFHALGPTHSVQKNVCQAFLSIQRPLLVHASNIFTKNLSNMRSLRVSGVLPGNTNSPCRSQRSSKSGTMCFTHRTSATCTATRDENYERAGIAHLKREQPKLVHTHPLRAGAGLKRRKITVFVGTPSMALIIKAA